MPSLIKRVHDCNDKLIIFIINIAASQLFPSSPPAIINATKNYVTFSPLNYSCIQSRSMKKKKKDNKQRHVVTFRKRLKTYGSS